ncbi:hypothetical protein ACMV5I_29005 [Serratia sp. T13T92]|uniref:hypothetical protein n=1 Tax=Serratia sp. T13T92 TaxID=3397496 RepID=UPI0039DF501F
MENHPTLNPTTEHCGDLTTLTKKPVEIDVHRFHDALGLMYPLNWSCSENGECETFMSAEMYCGNVTEIYTRIGIRYFMMRDHSNLNHDKILASVKEAFGLNQK